MSSLESMSALSGCTLLGLAGGALPTPVGGWESLSFQSGRSAVAPSASGSGHYSAMSAVSTIPIAAGVEGVGIAGVSLVGPPCPLGSLPLALAAGAGCRRPVTAAPGVLRVQVNVHLGGGFPFEEPSKGVCPSWNPFCPCRWRHYCATPVMKCDIGHLHTPCTPNQTFISPSFFVVSACHGISHGTFH